MYVLVAVPTTFTSHLQIDKIDMALPYAGATTISPHVFSMFQLMFAIITSALISGSVVGKIK